MNPRLLRYNGAALFRDRLYLLSVLCSAECIAEEALNAASCAGAKDALLEKEPSSGSGMLQDGADFLVRFIPLQGLTRDHSRLSDESYLIRMSGQRFSVSRLGEQSGTDGAAPGKQRTAVFSSIDDLPSDLSLDLDHIVRLASGDAMRSLVLSRQMRDSPLPETEVRRWARSSEWPKSRSPLHEAILAKADEIQSARIDGRPDGPGDLKPEERTPVGVYRSPLPRDTLELWPLGKTPAKTGR